jgi:hypothetical protein
MIRFIRKLFLRHRLASIAAHLDDISRQRTELDRSERYCIARATETRLELFNLDVVNRRA